MSSCSLRARSRLRRATIRGPGRTVIENAVYNVSGRWLQVLRQACNLKAGKVAAAANGLTLGIAGPVRKTDLG